MASVLRTPVLQHVKKTRKRKGKQKSKLEEPGNYYDVTDGLLGFFGQTRQASAKKAELLASKSAGERLSTRLFIVLSPNSI